MHPVLRSGRHICSHQSRSSRICAALKDARDDETALTNLFSGRPARGIVNSVMRELGPISDAPPAFPTASSALAPLKAASLGPEMEVAELTRSLPATPWEALQNCSRPPALTVRLKT